MPHISFNFPVELSRLIFCGCHKMLSHFSLKLQTSLFPFILYITLMLCGLPHQILSLFLNGTVQLFFVWISQKYSVCFHYLCVNVSFYFFVWMSHKYPWISIISKWTLHFVSFWVITDPFFFLSCVDCHTSFIKWKLHLS